MVDCDTGNFGCRGGWMRDSLQYTSVEGAMLDKDYASPTLGR